MEIHGDDLVIATHGRGFYILDDIEPLRELAADARKGTRLFAPAAAVRTRPADFTGTPMPKDEPRAPNPPNGAYIDYRLAAAPKGPVEIAILDQAGEVVRKFSSADTLPALDLGKIDTAPEWIDRPAPPEGTVGLHRFVWDFHYAPPTGIESERPVSGVWAPPGRYTVVLSVDGQTWRRPLAVVPDPRVTARPEDYQRAFALARRIEADRVRAHAALAKAKSEPLAAVAARLDQLAQAVDGADSAPTPDAESGYRQASAALAPLLAKP
jgi:hypothetical protein